MTREELDRLKAVAEQRTAAYQARLESHADSPSLPRFAELERQARHAYAEALAQWEHGKGIAGRPVEFSIAEEHK